jgi:DNA anti-recombination protein RmuC
MEDILSSKIAELNEVAKELDELLRDLEWREPDVAAERATLKKLERSKRRRDVDAIGAQRVVVEVLGAVLEDKRRRAKELMRRYNKLKAEIEKLSGKTLEELAHGGETPIS